MKALLGAMFLILTINSYSTEVIRSETDLISILENTQTAFQGISPPSLDMFITEEKVPYPVDWSGFSKKPQNI